MNKACGNMSKTDRISHKAIFHQSSPVQGAPKTQVTLMVITNVPCWCPPSSRTLLQVIFHSNPTISLFKGVERDAGAKRKKAGKITLLMD